MQILFDSRNALFKKPFGCLPLGETMTVTICCKDVGETGVLFCLEKDGEASIKHTMNHVEIRDGYNAYTAIITPEETGLYFYCFEMQTQNGFITVVRDAHNHPVIENGKPWQLTCYHRKYELNQEFFGRVMYQIFPDRFHKAGSVNPEAKLTPFWIHENMEDLPVYLPNERGEIINNDFFGGNLQGIIEKLPYLNDLGVGCIYLNPIFAAYSNHRYDTADYLQIDPLLGSKADFRELCRKAHELDIKIILDGVFSHTGSDSRYFDIHNRFGTGAYHNPQSPYRSWYQFQNYPHQYTAWWGIGTLPCTEENDLSFRQFILTGENSVVRYWLSQGADGWRLDVADELPDDFLFSLHEAVKSEKPDSLIIGEVWEDASNKISYDVRRKYFLGGSLDSVMNYVWRNAIMGFVRGEIDSFSLHEAIMTLCEHYPKESLLATMNILSTHDTPRILTSLGINDVPQGRDERAHFHLNEHDRELGKNRLFSAAFLLFCLPGCPCIYYGDEIGMEGFEDPFNRAYMGNRPSDQEILSFFKNLAHLKNTHPALRFGSLEPASFENGTYAFYRNSEKERMLMVLNVSDTPKSVSIEGEICFQKNLWQEGRGALLLPYGCVAMTLSVTNIAPPA